MNKANSILVITDRLHFIGGAETYIKEFASIFNRHKQSVDCLTYYQDFSLSEGSKINMLSFKHGNLKLFKHNVSRMYAFIKKLNELSNKNKYKYIFIHLYYAPFFVSLFNFFPHSKKYIIVHGIRYLEIKSTITPPVRHIFLGKIKRMITFGPDIIIYKLLQKYALVRCHKIITLSQYAKNQVISNFGINSDKIIIIPGAIDHKTYKPVSLDRRNHLKQALGISKSHDLIVLISRIEPRKNILSAIKAMGIVIKKCPKTLLLIVSPAQDQYDQGYLAECYNEVSKNNLGGNILFTTGIDNPKTIQYYQCADIALTISKDLETFGYTLIEALACGAPVIGTDVGNIPFILSKIDNRLISKPTYSDIADKITALIKMSKSEKAKIIRKCNKQILIDNNYDQFMNDYKKLLYEN